MILQTRKDFCNVLVLIKSKVHKWEDTKNKEKKCEITRVMLKIQLFLLSSKHCYKHDSRLLSM